MELQPCDHEVFQKGQPLLAVTTGPVGGAKKFEVWVQELAKKSGQRVDWHYSGGIAQVLYLGDRIAVMTSAKELELPDGCYIMRWFEDEAEGLYRAGVTEEPVNALGAFIDPISGEQAFLVNK